MTLSLAALAATLGVLAILDWQHELRVSAKAGTTAAEVIALKDPGQTLIDTGIYGAQSVCKAALTGARRTHKQVSAALLPPATWVPGVDARWEASCAAELEQIVGPSGPIDPSQIASQIEQNLGGAQFKGF